MRLTPQDIISYREAGLPEIWGHFWGASAGTIHAPQEDGAFHADIAGTWPVSNVGEPDYQYESFYASRCSKIYGRSATVQPSALTVNYYIRAQ